MRVLVDADGCPVVDIAIRLCRRYHRECILLCDTSHQMERDNARTIVVSKGADSVDYALVNLLCPGDIVVTQDYGLAAMCLARQGRPLHQDGMAYTQENIDSLLAARHTAGKIRRGGGRLKGPRPRTQEQNETFAHALETMLREDADTKQGEQ